jgi:predicted ATPase with chaperone activity
MNNVLFHPAAYSSGNDFTEDVLGLSARAHDKILRLARTVADLDDSAAIIPAHISEAVNYRMLDRNLWT